MKNKNNITSQDKKDWEDFLRKKDSIPDKEIDNHKKNNKFDQQKLQILDLHGFSLQDANDEVSNFINKAFLKGYKKLKIVTGKGLRSKHHLNPYVSQDNNILKNSVPDFIKNNENLKKKIIKISQAGNKDGGEGAFFVFLKKNFKE